MERGFTLIELIIVLLIIGLGSGLAVPRMFSVVNKLKLEIEQEKLCELMEKTAQESFFHQEFRALEGLGNKVMVLPQKRVVKCKYIEGNEGRISYAGNGISEGSGFYISSSSGE